MPARSFIQVQDREQIAAETGNTGIKSNRNEGSAASMLKLRLACVAAR
jgi:hypothetical protein